MYLSEMAALQERVRAERRRRDWSARRAAHAGGCSNTAWSEWERGKRELGPAVQAAIAQAFDWPADWPTVLATKPEDPEATPADVLVEIQTLRGEIASLRDELGVVRDRLDDVEQQPQRAARGGPSSRQPDYN